MTTYDFVGQGCGSYEVTQVAVPYGWKVRPVCSVSFVVLIVVGGLVAWMQWPTATTTTTNALSPDPCLATAVPLGMSETSKTQCCEKGFSKFCSTPTTQEPFDCDSRETWTPEKAAFCCERYQKGCTTAAPSLPPAVCQIWGDPHINTFDKGHADFYGEGIKWIVKSSDVYVQGRYKATPFTNGLAATDSIAVGGPFMQGHVLKVGPMETGQITFDDQVILASFGTFNAAGLGTVTYDDQGDLVDGAMSHLQRHIVHMALPAGVTIEVMRWSNHLNLRITMTPRQGQDGHCGNFDGNPADDNTDAIRARVGLGVAQSESLFRTYQVSVPGKRETVNDCPPDKRTAAEAQCKQAGRTDLQECIFDACFAGPQYVNEGE
jgi:hypothetical protein